MTGLRRAETDQTQILFPRQCRQLMKLNARRAALIEQLLRELVLVVANHLRASRLSLHCERVAQR